MYRVGGQRELTFVPGRDRGSRGGRGDRGRGDRGRGDRDRGRGDRYAAVWSCNGYTFSNVVVVQHLLISLTCTKLSGRVMTGSFQPYNKVTQR